MRKLVIASLMVVSFADCDVKLGNFANDRHLAEVGVADFRRMYASASYDSMYDLGSPELKTVISREQFVASVQASASYFGGYISSTQAGASCFPNQVRLVYLTEYEKGKATEWFS